MALQYVYEVWDAYEYTQVDMIYSLLRSIENSVKPILKALSGNITFGLNKVSNFLDDLGRAVSEGLSGLIEEAMHSLDWILESVMKPVWQAIRWIGDELRPAYEFISNAIVGATEVVATEIADIAVTVGNAISDGAAWLWDNIKYVGATVYEALTDALSWCWDYFIDVVIPAFFDAMTYIFESAPVQWLIEFIQEHIIDVFTGLFEIDESELQKWATKGAEFMRTLVESEPL